MNKWLNTFFFKLIIFLKRIYEIFDFLFLENAYMIYVWMNECMIFSKNALMNDFFLMHI